MILYCPGYSMGQVLRCIVHRRKYHAEDHSVILLPDYFRRSCSSMDFYTIGFAEVFYLDANNDLGFEEERIIGNFDKVWRHVMPYRLEDFDEIIVVAFFHSLMAYLAKNSIPFTLVEEATGMFRRVIHGKFAIEKFMESTIGWCQKYGLLDFSNRDLVPRIYANNREENGDPIEDDRVVFFQLSEELNRMSDPQRVSIGTFFKIDISRRTKKGVVFLCTSVIGSRDYSSMGEEIAVYKTWLDYFAKDLDLVVKLHPGDMIDYNEIFPKARIYGEEIPGELLFTVCHPDEDTLIAFGSSLEDELPIKRKLCFPYPQWEYDEYPLLHRFYAVKKIYEGICKIRKTKVYVSTTREYMFINFEIPLADISDLDEEETCILYLDSMEIDRSVLKKMLNMKHALVIFGEFGGQWMEVLYEIRQHVFRKDIEVIGEEGTREVHSLFLYTGDEELKEAALGICYTKKLKYLRAEAMMEANHPGSLDRREIMLCIAEKYHGCLRRENEVFSKEIEAFRR